MICQSMKIIFLHTNAFYCVHMASHMLGLQGVHVCRLSTTIRIVKSKKFTLDGQLKIGYIRFMLEKRVPTGQPKLWSCFQTLLSNTVTHTVRHIHVCVCVIILLIKYVYWSCINTSMLIFCWQESAEMKRDINFAKSVMQADFESKLQQKAIDL